MPGEILCVKIFGIAQTGTAEAGLVRIQDDLPSALQGDAKTIALAMDGGEVAENDERLAVLGLAVEGAK